MAATTKSDHSDESQPLLSQTNINPQKESDQRRREESTSTVFYLKLAVLAIGAFLANVDTSFVVATYNNISSEFGQAYAGPWILIAYNLGFSVALPMYGALGDRCGVAPPLMIAYASFGAGCALSGLAPNVWSVILGRAISGTGGGGMAAMVQYTITKSVSPERVAMYSSYIYVIQNLGKSVGGPIGGVLTDVVGWRWSFIGQAPIIAACMLCIAWLFLSTRKQVTDHPKDAEGNAGAQFSETERTTDFAGIAAFTIMLTSFLLAITILDPTSDLAPRSYAAVLLAMCSVAAISLFFIERDYATTPLIPLEFLKGALGVQMIVQVILLCAYFGIVSDAATYFVRTKNASNTNAALHLVPLAVGHATGSVSAGRIIKITKKYKTLGSVGVLLSALGYVLMATRWQGPISIPESLYIVLPALGMGIVTSTQFTALNLRISKERAASAISLYLLCQQLGVMLGVNGSESMLHFIFRCMLLGKLDSLPHKEEVVQNILDHTRYAFTLPESVQAAVIQSYIIGFRTVCALCGASMVLLYAILASMKEQSLT